MSNQSAAGGVHGLAEDLSPVDAGLNALGRAGVYQGGTVAGAFRGATGADGAAGTNMDNQNRQNAFGQISKEYGQAAAQWLWDNMTDGVWNGMNGQNSGAMYKTLKDMVEAHGGFGGVDKGNGQGNSNSELQDVDKGIDPGDAGGPNGEPSRNDAARDGWLTEYDEQKRNGVQYPKKPGT
jgi:hypothetical protein